MFLHHFAVGAWMVTMSSYVAANSGAERRGHVRRGIHWRRLRRRSLGRTGLAVSHRDARRSLFRGRANHGRVEPALRRGAVDGGHGDGVLGVLRRRARVLSVLLSELFAWRRRWRCTISAIPRGNIPVVRAFGTLGWVAAGVFVGLGLAGRYGRRHRSNRHAHEDRRRRPAGDGGVLPVAAAHAAGESSVASVGDAGAVAGHCGGDLFRIAAVSCT